MTSPGGGNIGTVTGRVRINYESSNVAKVTRDVNNFQSTLTAAGHAGETSAKGVSQATGAISQLSAATAKLGKTHVPNPVAGLGAAVQKETAAAQGAITKAMADFQKSVVKSMNVTAPVRISPRDVTIDRTAFTKAIEEWKRSGAKQLSMTTLTGSVRYSPTVTVDSASATKAGKQWKAEFDRAAKSSGSPLSVGGAGAAGGAAGGGSGGGGLASAIPMLGRITAGAGAAAVAVGAVGYVLTKGFQRLNSLDTAATKLKALGYNTKQIEGISKSALAAVDKTAFGLDEAFATAASAIASGIKPGEDLTGYLKMVADNAALAGMGMQEMGYIFGKVANTGKLQGDEMNIFMERNIDVVGNLSKHLNVARGTVKQMVTDGKIDFATFSAAMNANSGAAITMGNSISGSFKNLGASVSRLGANLLKPLFGDATGDAGPVALALQKVTDWVNMLGEAVKNNQSGIVTFWEVLGKGGMIAGKVFVTVVSIISDAVVKVTEIIGDLTGWLSTAFAAIADTVGADGVAENARNFADSMHDLGTGLRENRDINMGKLNRGLDQGWDSLTKWAQGARDAANKGDDLGDSVAATEPKMIGLKEALDKLQIKADAATTALEGTNEQFKEFLKQVREKGGTDDLIKSLTDIRSRFENGGRQVKAFADAIDKMKDSTASASDKADSLISSLQGLGLLPGGDALASYNEEFDKMTSYMSTIIDLSDTMGNALANSNGTLDLNSQNGRNLLQQITTMRKEMVALAASGEATPDEAYARTVEGLNQLLQGQAGISPEVAQKIIDTYLPKGAILESLKAQNPTQALENIFKDDPARLQSELNLLTTTNDLLAQIVGPDGSLHIPTVLDTPGKPGTPAPTANAGTATGAPKLGPGMTLRPGAQPFTGPLVPGSEGGYVTAPDGSVWKKEDWVAQGSGPPGMPKAPPVLGPPAPAPTNVLAPDDLGGLLGATTPEDQGKNLVALANNQEQFAKALADNPEIAKSLQSLTDQANAQGENMGVALAQGILTATPEVKDALIKLAQLAGDYLGNSPAKYGPLSGKGWTLSRGKVFTQDWAKGIASEAASVEGAANDVAGSAASGFTSGGGAVTLNDGITQLIGDLQAFSDFGKHILEFGNQLADIAIGVAKFANDMSGGALFPKTYVTDPTVMPKGSALGPWSPQGNRAAQPGTNGFPNQPGPTNGQPAIPTTAKGDEVAGEFIRQAKAAGLGEEQILAGLGVLSQETGFGTNPATNNVQNQNGTPGITGVFQQDMGYRQYGDPRDPNVAIKGFIDQYTKTGDGLNDPNPWRQALDVQRPARVGAGGYDDRGNGDGAYLQAQQRATALEVYNRLGGQPVPAIDPNGPNPERTTPLRTTAPGNNVTDITPGTPGGLLAGLDVSGKGVNLAGAHSQVALVAAIAKKFGLEMTSGATNHSQDSGFHPSGQAGDFSNGQGNTPEQAAFAKFMATNFGPMLQELIYSDPNAPGVLRGGGKDVTGTGYYSSDTLDEHGNHVHIAIKDAVAEAFTQAVSQASGIDVSSLVAGVSQGQPGLPVTLTGQPALDLGALRQNTNGLPSMPAQLEQLVSGDPILQDAMTNQAGLTKDSVVPVLQHLDTLQAQQDKLGTPESKLMSQQLGGYKTQLQGQFGLKEGPSQLDQATSIISGVSGIASDIFGLFDQTLKVIAATQDIGNTLVRGIENTKDVNKIVDGVQEFITLAAKGFQTAGDITSMVGSIMSIGAGADFGASGGVSAVGQMLGLVGQAISAVNTGIDLAQEGYAIAMKYVGRFIQSWTGLTGASDMKYLLDEVTGQVQMYSSDNPQDKKTFNTIGRMLGDSTSGTSRPPVVNNMTVYQGPGQDPRDTMDDMMFTVRASGQGAFGYAV